MSLDISGRKVTLDNDRHVFVGRNRDDATTLYIEMRNKSDYTYFKLSPEAGEALSGLLAGEPLGEALNWVGPTPKRYQWALVPE